MMKKPKIGNDTGVMDKESLNHVSQENKSRQSPISSNLRAATSQPMLMDTVPARKLYASNIHKSKSD